MILPVGIAVSKLALHASIPSASLVVASLLYVVLIIRLLSVKALAILVHLAGLVMHLACTLELIERHIADAIIPLQSLMILAILVLVLLLALSLISIDE